MWIFKTFSFFPNKKQMTEGTNKYKQLNKIRKVIQSVLIQTGCLTDKQTEGQTDRRKDSLRIYIF